MCFTAKDPSFNYSRRDVILSVSESRKVPLSGTYIIFDLTPTPSLGEIRHLRHIELSLLEPFHISFALFRLFVLLRPDSSFPQPPPPSHGFTLMNRDYCSVLANSTLTSPLLKKTGLTVTSLRGLAPASAWDCWPGAPSACSCRIAPRSGSGSRRATRTERRLPSWARASPLSTGTILRALHRRWRRRRRSSSRRMVTGRSGKKERGKERGKEVWFTN